MNRTDTNSAETTNPVIDTARLTLSQLAAAGIPEASDLAGMLGFSGFMKNYNVTEDTVYAFAVIQEARYGFVNRCIENSGIQDIMDLGCGFSPRGLVMARNGRHYLGCDLESAVSAMSEIAANVSANEKLPGRFSYRLTDITNPAAVTKAASSINGKTLMCCEGLLIYLGMYEFDSMLSGISSVLHEHDGYFITPDLATSQFMKGILTAMLGKEKGTETLFAIGRSISEKSDTEFTSALSEMSADRMQKLLEKHDLRGETVPFLPENAGLHSFERLTDKQICSIRQNLSGITCLKLTAGRNTVRNHILSPDRFSADISREGCTLSISLTGRLDSVSAPVLLDEYKKSSAGEKITGINIDAEELEYISSAGLRTILIMQKDLTENKIHIHGAGKTVLDILEQTGFSNILKTD